MLASYVHFERDPEVVNQYYASADGIEAEDIRTIANKYFIDSGRTTVTMSALEKVTGFEQEADLDGLTAKLNQPKGESLFTLLDKRSSSPLVDVNFLFYTGAAADPEG
jgi:zinc protease